MSRVASVLGLLLALTSFACTKSHDVTAAGAPLGDEGTAGVAGADLGTAGTESGTAGTTNVGTAGTGVGTAGTGVGTAGTTAGTGTGNPFPPGTGCNNCQDANVGGQLTLASCCAEAAGGGETCGLDLSSLGMPGCLERDGAGTPDDTCPSSNQQVITLPGCCRPDGKCGSLDTFIGLGCTPQADGIDQDCGPQ